MSESDNSNGNVKKRRLDYDSGSVSEKSTLTFIQTGGTIDKDYPRLHSGHAFEIHEPACVRTLEKLNPSFRYNVLSCCRKDSLDITIDDLQKLADLLASDKSSDGVVVTHGTDTIAATVAFLSEFTFSKPIVITGAMRPERFSNTDAEVNLGMAIAAAQLCPPGIYVCMHGAVMAEGEIGRDMSTGKYFRRRKILTAECNE